jgi:hypothetical protein
MQSSRRRLTDVTRDPLYGQADGIGKLPPELVEVPTLRTYVRVRSGRHGGFPMTKTVPVRRHKRSTPKTPAHPGPGKKPGPKPVTVKKHKRS